MTATAVGLRGISKQFANVRAVDALSAEIPRGSIYGFLGPNGAGKTTTIRMMVGILRPDAGDIRVLGSADVAGIKTRLGYLPEEKGLYKKMRTLELVTYFGRLKGMSRSAAREEGSRLLDAFDLSDWKHEKCEALSKGMGQKVQIAATLIHQPELIVLDEPFSGLDPVNIELVRNTILELKQKGRTVIFSTHIMEQAEQVCDSVLLIDHGSKLLDGDLASVRASADRTVTIDYDGDGSVLTGLPGIRRVNDAGKHAELSLEPGTDPQRILEALVDRLRIRRFDTREASLHEVFVRAVSGGP